MSEQTWYSNPKVPGYFTKIPTEQIPLRLLSGNEVLTYQRTSFGEYVQDGYYIPYTRLNDGTKKWEDGRLFVGSHGLYGDPIYWGNLVSLNNNPFEKFENYAQLQIPTAIKATLYHFVSYQDPQDHLVIYWNRLTKSWYVWHSDKSLYANFVAFEVMKHHYCNMNEPNTRFILKEIYHTVDNVSIKDLLPLFIR